MSHSARRLFFICLFLFILILGLVFFLKNNQIITFNYIVGTLNMPVSVLMLLTFAAGAVLGVIALLPIVLRLKHQARKLKKQVKTTEKEIENLRVLPVKD